MNLLCRLGSSFLLCVAASLLCSVPAVSQTAGCTAEAARAVTLRDGRHNFDFDLGPLKLHLSRLQRPRTVSAKWNERDGTVVVRILWPGIITDAARFEPSYTDDGGGQPWEPEFLADVTVADVTRAKS